MGNPNFHYEMDYWTRLGTRLLPAPLRPHLEECHLLCLIPSANEVFGKDSGWSFLMKLIGVDVGGTFTDIVYTDTASNRTLIHKVPTTPDDPSGGVMAGIVELCGRHGIERAEIDHVFHGTTIATNAVLEYRGAATGIVTRRLQPTSSRQA